MCPFVGKSAISEVSPSRQDLNFSWHGFGYFIEVGVVMLLGFKVCGFGSEKEESTAASHMVNTLHPLNKASR